MCVPAGTRNHFARDLGVDRHDVVGSLDAFTDGVERRIDVAEVNGRLFLNNVSLGIYGDAVRRPAYRDAKVRTLLETADEVLGPGAPVPELRLVDAAEPVHAGIDGEAVDLSPALEFVIRPTALRVRISAHHPGVSPSGPRL